LTADCCYHFLLVEGVRRDGGQDQYYAVFVSPGCRYQVTVSFRLPSLQPSPVSWTIKQHALVPEQQAGDPWVAWTPFDHRCNALRQQLMNLQWYT